ncbi:MFS transporter [Blastococcus sp. PRF04-17]|uniref:MFS transporter n=1 Tax=Blastococcus sp. PRF04-17 TaxID=2933797 RepID=UPI001FF447F9|nr:MFS transporter [Blastococcus sp. PRF04-17]UOY02279.1 MFS transporter [Blastococcus sp. PRF04-17]
MGPRRLSAEVGFWATAGALLVVMAVGTAPAALWPLYQVADGLSDTVISVLAGAVVIGATISFLALGHLSDRYGRRRVLVPAVLTSASSVLVMALVPTVPGLLTGRILTGVGLGVVAPTATAYLLDLHRLARPASGSIRRPATVATAANLGGLAVGPVLAGALAQLFPAPLVLVYAVLAVVLCTSALLLVRCPETVTPGLVRRARFDLRPGAGVTFWGGATGGFVSFATSGALGALGAVVLHDQLDVSSTLLWGASIGLVHATSALAQIAAASWSTGQLFAVGGSLLAGGLALMVTALADPSVWLWLAGCTVTGAACGLLFKAALVTSTLAAQPSGRAGVLAVFFTTAYLGMASGGIVFALLREWTTPTTALAWLSAGLCAVALAGALAAARRPAGP